MWQIPNGQSVLLGCKRKENVQGLQKPRSQGGAVVNTKPCDTLATCPGRICRISNEGESTVTSAGDPCWARGKIFLSFQSGTKILWPFTKAKEKNKKSLGRRDINDKWISLKSALLWTLKKSKLVLETNKFVWVLWGLRGLAHKSQFEAIACFYLFSHHINSFGSFFFLLKIAFT